MIRPAARAVFALLLALALCPARAQQPTPTVQPGTTIRLTLTDGSRPTGRVVSSSDSAIVLSEGGGLRTVPTASILQTEVGHNGWARGGMTGAIIGAVVGVVGLITINDLICDSSNCPLGPQHILGGAAAGAVPGFAIGSVIGSFRTRWTVSSGAAGAARRDPESFGASRGWTVSLRLESVR